MENKVVVRVKVRVRLLGGAERAVGLCVGRRTVKGQVRLRGRPCCPDVAKQHVSCHRAQSNLGGHNVSWNVALAWSMICLIKHQEHVSKGLRA